MYIVIMGGGAGKRFWPKSRENLPKQFLKILGENSMMRETFNRAVMLTDLEKIFVVTHERFVPKVKEELFEMKPKNIIAEPQSKNTAPCIALSLFYLKKYFPPDNILFLPADHLIADTNEFVELARSAEKRMMSAPGILAFGIKPRYAETGYGYIKKGILLEKASGHPIYEVQAFTEKPDKRKASEYLQRGDYLWNSGIYLFNQKRLAQAFKRHMPKTLDKFANARFDADIWSPSQEIKDIYSSLEPIALEYGIMEKEGGIELMEGNFGWSDVGSWKALEEIWPSDENRNNIKGKYFSKASSGIIADTQDKLLVTLGAEDLVIIDTDDVLFVCKKDMTDKMKEMLDEMKREGLDKYL